MRSWGAERIAKAARGELLAAGERASGPSPGPVRVVIDSREAGPDALFVGLPGARTHGGEYATAVLQAGAWGVLTDPQHARGALACADVAQAGGGALIGAEDPLRALQDLATAWRRHLGVPVVGVTGSTGKTTTKDLLLALLAPHRRTFASRANFNTEIGLPLELLAAPEDTQLLVLEMGMRGPGQIAELARIAEPTVGVIVSIGPVHLELLGTIQAIAAAKSELTAALRPGEGTAVVPVDEPLLTPHRRKDIDTITFGPGGDVRLVAEDAHGVQIDSCGTQIELALDFTQAHLRRNLLAAVAASQAVGVTPVGQLALSLSPGRGQRTTLPNGVVVIDDCYNANPMSMRAALTDLAASAAPDGRRVAVLGDMLELGPDASRFHEEIGEAAAGAADVLVTVGTLAERIGSRFPGEHHHAESASEAATLAAALVRPGDTVLVKGSRGVALERVCDALAAAGGTR